MSRVLPLHEIPLDFFPQESRDAVAARPLGPGQAWYAYQCTAMDASYLGMVHLLKCGYGCTHETPPPHLPDGPWGAGWKFRLIGEIEVPE